MICNFLAIRIVRFIFKHFSVFVLSMNKEFSDIIYLNRSVFNLKKGYTRLFMSFYSYFCLFISVGFDPQKNTYHTIPKNLLEFREMDALPTALKNHSPEELSMLLMAQSAGFRKSCLGMYNEQKLDRKNKAMKNKALKPKVPVGKWQD